MALIPEAHLAQVPVLCFVSLLAMPDQQTALEYRMVELSAAVEVT